MKKLVIVFMVALLATAYVVTVHLVGATTQAKGDRSIPGRIETKLKEKESRFKFQPRGTGGKAVKQQWRAGKEFVTITISEKESADEAARYVQMVIGSVSAGVVTQERGLGDEAYIIKSSPQVVERGEHVGLVFRQDNVLISINATSEQVAKRFARHIVEELRTK